MPLNTQGDVLSDYEIESMVVEKGLTAPRVTKEHIDKMMDRCTFDIHHIRDSTTFVVTCLIDGFTLGVGTSACVDIKNFDRSLGIDIAMSDAVQKSRKKLWELEGYALHKAMVSGHG